MNHSLPFSISSIDHIAIRVKDIDTSIKWYTNNLGLIHILSNHPDFGKDPAMLCTKDYKQSSIDKNHSFHSKSNNQAQCIALVPYSNERQKVPFHPNSKHEKEVQNMNYSSVFDHVAFRLSKDDYNIASQEFIKKGLAVEEDHGLQKSTYLRDIDNNIVELTTWEIN